MEKTTFYSFLDSATFREVNFRFNDLSDDVEVHHTTQILSNLVIHTP